jgi:hypothetical protein
MNKIVLGIDPGASGGMALWDGTEMHAHPMPKTETDICDLIRELAYTVVIIKEHKVEYALNQPGFKVHIERVHSFPGQGVSSTFKFGQGYGFLRGSLIALGVPFEEVSPRTWMKDIPKKKGMTKTQWKNVLKGRAQQLYPHLKVTLATADAILIAHWGKTKDNN